jgi:hypothetical protein
MVILRCTRELLARVTRAPAEPAATSTTRLGDWYVALVRVGPRQYLLAISERTRLPVLVPGRDAPKTANASRRPPGTESAFPSSLPRSAGRVLANPQTKTASD